MFRGLLCRMVGYASAAHAFDGGYQRDFIGYHRGRVDCGRCGWITNRKMVGVNRGRFGKREHLRRLRCDRAHARNVQEKGALSWNMLLLPHG